jgi:hypothetical protein
VTYYHGGVPGLTVGDELLPPSRSGRTDSLASIAAANRIEGSAVMRDDRVFLGTLYEIGLLYAAMYPTLSGGWVYECEPVGPVEPDPDYRGDPSESVQCASAIVTRVLGRLSPSQVRSIRKLIAA